WIRFGAESLFTADLSFETILLLGVIAGRFAGITGGVLLALPEIFSRSWLVLPMNVLVGFVAGQLRRFAPSHEEVWKFSPFNYFSVSRWLRRRDQPRPSLTDWQMMFLLTIVLLRFMGSEAGFWLKGYSVLPNARWVEVLTYATSVVVIVIQ